MKFPRGWIGISGWEELLTGITVRFICRASGGSGLILVWVSWETGYATWPILSIMLWGWTIRAASRRIRLTMILRNILRFLRLPAPFAMTSRLPINTRLLP